MSDRLKNKAVIITGAGQTPGQDIGNGRAMAIRFAEEGARLFLVARHQDHVDETARMIREKYPDAEVYTCACDVTDEDAVKEMFRTASEKLGTIEVLVNNVGVSSPKDGGLFVTDSETFDFMMDTNVKAAMFQLRHIYPYLKEHGGSIVQTASVAGVSVYAGDGPLLYNLSKCAMIRLGEAAAARFAKDGIRVNTIILGFVQTAMGVEHNIEKSGKTREEVLKDRDSRVPLKGGQGTAWDTANAALFLASDESKFITGANLPVDGGQTVIKG